MIQALKTVLPIKRQESAKVKRQVRLLLSKEEAEEKLLLYQKKNQKARARLLEALLRDGTDGVLPYELVVQKLNITRTVVRALEEQNVLALESENVFRNPLADNPGIGADQEESESSEKAFSLYNGSEGGNPNGLERAESRTENLADSWRDRKRKDGSLYRMDQTNGVGRPTGNRSDSGDRADLSDGDAVLSSVR